MCSSIEETKDILETEVNMKNLEKKRRTRRKSSTAAFSSRLVIRQSAEEDNISKQLLSTALILSSGELTGSYGMGISAVECEGVAEQGDTEEGSGKKTRKADQEDEAQQLKLREKELLKETFKSLKIYQ